MTDTDGLVVALPDRLQRARLLVTGTRFLAAVSWLGVLAVVSLLSSGTVLVLLVLPLFITAVAVWASRASRRRRPAPPPGRGEESEVPGRTRTGPDALVVVPLAYAAILTWVGFASLALASTGSVILVAVPLVMTVVARVARRYLSAQEAEDASR
jgi:ABC-type nickel/cobalt efflux system permease component RcnA